MHRRSIPEGNSDRLRSDRARLLHDFAAPAFGKASIWPKAGRVLPIPPGHQRRRGKGNSIDAIRLEILFPVNFPHFGMNYKLRGRSIKLLSGGSDNQEFRYYIGDKLGASTPRPLGGSTHGLPSQGVLRRSAAKRKWPTISAAGG